MAISVGIGLVVSLNQSLIMYVGCPKSKFPYVVKNQKKYSKNSEKIIFYSSWVHHFPK